MLTMLPSSVVFVKASRRIYFAHYLYPEIASQSSHLRVVVRFLARGDFFKSRRQPARLVALHLTADISPPEVPPLLLQRVQAVNEVLDDFLLLRSALNGACLRLSVPTPLSERRPEEPRPLRSERFNSGGEKYLLLPLTPEISYRCFEKCPKYFWHP